MPKGSEQVIFNWPVDEDGKPMALIGFSVGEKIGLPNYSNVDIGPASVLRFCKDSEVQDALRSSAQDVELIVGEEREKVLAVVQQTK